MSSITAFTMPFTESVSCFTVPMPFAIHVVVCVLISCPMTFAIVVSSNFRQSNLPAGTSIVSLAVILRSFTSTLMLKALPCMFAPSVIVMLS